MNTLREFFTSSSGLAPARQGLGLGWVISALTGVAILLGAKEAGACPKEDISCGSWADCAELNEDTPYRECTTRWNNKCEKYYEVCDCVSSCP